MVPSPSRRRFGFGLLLALLAVLALTPVVGAASAKTNAAPKPTIVLVHGAWADGSGWSSVIKQLQSKGYPVAAPANPLRSLSSDAAYLASQLALVKGPIILVGHSYGGAVVTNAAVGNPNVKALVYLAAFQPDTGESALGLAALNPGSQLPTAIIPEPYDAGTLGSGVDVYVDPAQFRAAFTSNEVSPAAAAVMASAQRPVTLAALQEPSVGAAWKTIPSWFLVTQNDNAIPAATQRFEAQRAGSHVTEVASGHTVMVSHPDAVVKIIRAADAATS